MKQKAYMTLCMDEMKAEADAMHLKPQRNKTISQWAQAFAHALLEPNNFDQIAIEAGLDSATLDDALKTREGQRIGNAMIGRLRDNGDLEWDQAARTKQSLIELIDRGVSEGTMSPGFAPKVLEIISKMPDARQGSTEPVLPPARFKGTAAELIAAINSWVDEQSGVQAPASLR